MIVDTNALSALAKKDKSLLDRMQDAERLALTFITIGEFTYGIRQSSVRNELELWLKQQLVARFEILFPDFSTVEHYADVRLLLRRKGTPIPANGIWIAALAIQHHLPILSLDRHFNSVEGMTRIAW